jgi:hypothetical protein
MEKSSIDFATGVSASMRQDIKEVLGVHNEALSEKYLACLRMLALSYGPLWAHYLGGYQDRLLGGPLGLPDLRCTVLDGVKHKDYTGEVLG